MNVVIDLALAGLLLAYAVAGHRQGFILSLMSLVGLVGGAALGMAVLPVVLEMLHIAPDSPVARSMLVVAGVWMLAGFGQAVGRWAGMWLRARVRRPGLEHLDRGMGSGLMLVASALVVWFVAASLKPAMPPDIARPLAESRVLQTLDRVVPGTTGGLFASFRDYLDQSGFPRVFDRIGPEPIQPVAPPDPALADSPVAQQARASIVRVTGTGARCDRDQEGTGWVLRPGRVVTNAHVVAGMRGIRVQERGTGTRLDARVVLMDPDRDLAILDVPDLQAPALVQGPELPRGASAIVAGYPLDGPYRVDSARVRNVMRASGRDIRDTRSVEREIYSLATTVQPGNSGGPLLDPQGHVVGVIFARSLDDERTGYALTLDEVRGDLSSSSTTETSTGACAVG